MSAEETIFDPATDLFTETALRRLLLLEEEQRKEGFVAGIPLGLREEIDAADDEHHALFEAYRLEEQKKEGGAFAVDGAIEVTALPDAPGEWEPVGERVTRARFRTKPEWADQAQGRVGWFMAARRVKLFREKRTGKHRAVISDEPNPVQEKFQFLFKTLHRRYHYAISEAERVARKRLEEMLKPHQRIMFELTDSFSEDGRSGVTYLFRRNRPVLAWRIRKDAATTAGHNLCALCLHPYAYYLGTWAGTLCPSDELIANLQLMRADEHFYWRKANQIEWGESNSGL